MVPTLLLLLAPHHVTVPISIRGTPSVENSPKESGAQPLAAFTYLASSKYQSQKSVPGCPRLVKPLLASSISYYNTGCPQDGASVTEQHTCPSVTTLIYSSGSMSTQLPLLGTFSLVPEPLCEANSPGHLPLHAALMSLQLPHPKDLAAWCVCFQRTAGILPRTLGCPLLPATLWIPSSTDSEQAASLPSSCLSSASTNFLSLPSSHFFILNAMGTILPFGG